MQNFEGTNKEYYGIFRSGLSPLSVFVVDVNECLPINPCKNGGVCKNTKGSYQCTCVGRFYGGKNCDQGNLTYVK